MGTNKHRLHNLERAIRPPNVQGLTADERAVLLMLTFRQRVLPAWLQTAEAWDANGRPPAAAADKQAAAETRNRIERLTPALLTANTRTNELTEQGRVQAVIERLTAWGLWTKPNPTPPDVVTILDRYERVFPDEAN